jgi:hypothetical protein
MRLSWPRDDDKRRAIIGDFPPAMMCGMPGTNFSFINTTSWDVELYSRQLGASHIDLVRYCKSKWHPVIHQLLLSPSSL